MLKVEPYEIQSFTDGALTKSHVRFYLAKVAAWKKAFDGKAYDFDSLPDTQKVKFFPQYRTLEEKRQAIINYKESNRAALAAFDREIKAEGLVKQLPSEILGGIAKAKAFGLSENDAKRLCRLTGWLHMLRNGGKLGFATRDGLLEAALETMQTEHDNGLLYGQRMDSLQYLKKKLKVYGDNGMGALVSKKSGNKNAEKFPEWAKKLVYSEYTRPGVKLLVPEVYQRYVRHHSARLDSVSLKVVYQRISTDRTVDGQVWPVNRLFTRVQFIDTETGEVVEVEPVSFERVRSYLMAETTQIKAYKPRHGAKAYNDKYAPYVSMRGPKNSLAIVSADDYWMNFWVATDKGKTFRPVVYVVWDVMTGVPIGFSFGESQTKELVMSAMYDAIAFMGGKVAPEIEVDSFGRSKKAEKDGERLEDKMNALYTHVSYRKDPQGKKAERFNKMMQEEYWRNKAGYLGDNIKGRKKIDSHRNDDAEYPIITMGDIIAWWREYRAMKLAQKHTSGRTNAELLKLPHPEARTLDNEQLAWHFGQVRTLTVRRSQIDVDINKKMKSFSVDMAALINHPHGGTVKENGKVRVRFLSNPTNPTEQWATPESAWLYGIQNEDEPWKDVLIGELLEKSTVNRAKIEREETDEAAFKVHFKLKNKQGKFIDEAHGAMYDEHIEANPWAAAKVTGDEDYKELEVRNNRLGNRFEVEKEEPKEPEAPKVNRLGKRF